MVAKELEREIDPKSPHAEDMRLLREQTERCRDILAKLNELSGEGEPFDRMPLSALIEEVVGAASQFRHRDRRDDLPPTKSDARWARAIRPSSTGLAIFWRMPSISRASGSRSWPIGTRTTVTIIISDDGPGFAPEVMSRIGEPYVRSRRRRRMYASDDTGLGLGFFIAKTLAGALGATLTFVNRPFPRSGAVVTMRWARAEFEQLPQSLDLENRPPALNA